MRTKSGILLRRPDIFCEDSAHTRLMMPSNKFFVTLMLACAVVISPARAAAAAGQLDHTFASGGIFLASNAGIRNSVATAVAIDSKGRIVVAGETLGRVSVLRLNSNGTLDTAFGDHGTASIAFFVAGEIAACLVF